MPLPAALATAPEWRVKRSYSTENGGKLSFGSFVVTDMHRGWRRSKSKGAQVSLNFSTDEDDPTDFITINYDQTRSRQKVSFMLWPLEGQAPWPVQGVDSTWQQDPDENGNYQTLHTVYRSTLQGPAKMAWQLRLDTRYGRHLEYQVSGQLTRSATDTVVRVRPIFNYAEHPQAWVQPKSGEPTGYAFVHLNGRQVLGAVEVINGGTVWLAADMSKELHSALAATATALLLMPRHDW